MPKKKVIRKKITPKQKENYEFMQEYRRLTKVKRASKDSWTEEELPGGKRENPWGPYNRRKKARKNVRKRKAR